MYTVFDHVIDASISLKTWYADMSCLFKHNFAKNKKLQRPLDSDAELDIAAVTKASKRCSLYIFIKRDKIIRKNQGC